MRFGENNSVKYAYYWRALGDGTFQYIIDNDTDPETQVGPGDFNIINQDAEREALAGNISASEIGSYSPGWEGLRSAYAPVYDSKGNIYAVAGVDINESKVYAVAGVDISDEFIFRQHQDAHKMTLLQLIVVPISVIFGVINMFLYRKKAIQIEEAHVKLQYFNNNLRRAFSTYLSEDVVEEIVSDPTRLQLGGIKRHMTAIFTDVRGFTGIAEKLSPEHLVDLLNHYLSTMSDAILEQKGTIDKYEGDAIIAFFGAPLELPDHAIKACTAAVLMKRLEADVNDYVMKNDISPSPLLTRIGINSGDMVVGNMGTQKKMNYTIISNAVNLAARLEGVNKQYGTWILATENTIRETAGWFLTRRLDKIRVVGIKEPVQIYEVLETMEYSTQALRQKIDHFHSALDFFEARRWNDAGKGFLQILKQFPDDGPSSLYVNRCRQYIKNEPLPDWDGVFNMDEK
jgi:class 3 adenylate cyclase